MENPFKKYIFFLREGGQIIDINTDAFNLSDEAFHLFKELFDTHYGAIYEHENLISIHTGGWSENEELIGYFKDTSWWFKNHCITSKGGHYYFDTDSSSEKKWEIVSTPAESGM